VQDKIIQHSLFDSSSLYQTLSIPTLSLLMSKTSLGEWKEKIYNYQHKTRNVKLTSQSSLFNEIDQVQELIKINPFELPLQPVEFYRLPVSDRGDASIYFIIDFVDHIILYIGETCRSNLRWKGQHDCKRYIQNYQNLHYSHGIKTAINAGFWNYAPTSSKSRQKLELDLIYDWRSPFNKEIWQYWGTPFTN
jgi:hypothetical protein